MSDLNSLNELEAEKIVLQNLHKNANKVLKTWERSGHTFDLKLKRLALIVIDMQDYYCSARTGVELNNIENVIDNINELSNCCHKLNIPVIWLRQNFTVTDGKSDAGIYELLHKRPLSDSICNLHPESEIYKAMNYNQLNDYQLTKNRYSPFINNSSELNKKLQDIKRNQLIFTGVVTNVCVESAIRDAMQFDYESIIVSDATSSFNRVFHEVSLLNIKLFFGDVYNTKDLIEKLKTI